MPGETILFLTGHLALPRLERVLASLGRTDFAWAIEDIGVKVAALMTGEIIERRLKTPVAATRVVVPGRCRADLDRLAQRFGVPFVRGPDEVVDLPAFLGRRGAPPDLSRHDMRIFAEIVDASALGLPELAARGAELAAAGADVVDLGCLPDTPFPPSGRRHRRAEAGGPPGQRRFRRPGRADAGDACRRRLSPVAERDHARHRRGRRRGAGARSRRAARHGLARPCDRKGGGP